MRQQPTQLNEVPWNEQTPAQRQQTLQRQRQAQQQTQQQQWTQTQPVQQPRHNRSSRRVPYKLSLSSSNRKAQPQKQTAQPYQDLLQTPAHTTAQQPKTQQAARSPKRPRHQQTAEKKDERRWMVQCGSFKGAEQAETVRAQLAFEGFDSRITTNSGWNLRSKVDRSKRKNADGTISRLKVAGHTNCIRLASGVETPKSPIYHLIQP